MPGDPVAALAPWTGFHGKLPARGDFVRAGLPREFLAPWDAWISAMMAEAQGRLGEAWDAAWDGAPPCRFLLAAELCGPHRVVGVWLPSRDRVGRAYPLTLVMQDAAGRTGPFMERAERAGLAALADGLDPAALALCLAPPWPDAADPPSPPGHDSLWRQGRGWVACAGLPDTGMFAALLLGRDAS